MTPPRDVGDVLVSPEWVASRLDRFASADPAYRLLEVDADPDRYREGHLPGAVGLDWHADFCADDRNDILDAGALARLLGRAGVGDDTTVVVYGDSSNWFAAYAYWLLTYYRQDDVRLLDGGRRFWVEHDLPTTRAAPDPPTVAYEGSGVDTSVRARRDGVRRALDTHTKLVDVRLPDEYRGARTALPGGAESAVRGGHVPGARNIVWSKNTRPDGRFRPRDELEALYAADGVTPGDDVITYCRIGERSAVTWFVLTQLLGYDSVRNYDGSWVEWGNLVGVPVERGA